VCGGRAAASPNLKSNQIQPLSCTPRPAYTPAHTVGNDKLPSPLGLYIVYFSAACCLHKLTTHSHIYTFTASPLPARNPISSSAAKHGNLPQHQENVPGLIRSPVRTSQFGKWEGTLNPFFLFPFSFFTYTHTRTGGLALRPPQADRYAPHA